MATIDVTGTVFWDSGVPFEQSGRVSQALIKITSGATSATVSTDDDGDFAIRGVEDTDELALIVLHEDAAPQTLTLAAGEFGGPVELGLKPRDGRSAPGVGLLTLCLCIVALGVLTAVYLSSHKRVADDNAALRTALSDALAALPDTPERAGPQALAAKLQAVRGARDALAATRIPPDDALARTLERIAVWDPGAAADLAELAALRDRALSALRPGPNGYFWSAWPWILFELWCWGLLGVLLNKIVRIGWYLRAGRYYPLGTWMHLSHIVATPFLAIVAVLVLSFLKVQSDAQVIMDLSNPLFMVLAAFLLSVNPWPLWDFVIRQGEKIRRSGGDG